ncbi:MAG: class I SAM-dependent rRNA methyltransferase [Polyangiaceae bacterium]|nr:class I SAM-dependent rRNA methyltransferase [Polyangiaceae bacterium]
MRLLVSDSAAASLERGHPWVYREALKKLPPQIGAGDVVDLNDSKGNFVGRGLFDPTSPIAVRIHHRDPHTPLDVDSFIRRIKAACALRTGRFDPADTNAYRLVNGEGDRIPGLVIDRYRDVAIVRLDGASLDVWLERIEPKLAQFFGEIGIFSCAKRVMRDERDAASTRITPLWGSTAPIRMFIRERGIALEVDLHFGHKTGAFLDHRENLSLVRMLSKNRKRVLNLFSYTGGFSIAAALGGAEHVTSIDTAGPAHASAQRSFRENGLDPSVHTFVTGDAFAFLDAAKVRGEVFDFVICDPPSFAPNEKSKPRALTSYKKLHRACAGVLSRGGVFCAASCSSHVSFDDFMGTLDDATLERTDLRVTHTLGQPTDHPWLPAWPEGRYLKLAVLE